MATKLQYGREVKDALQGAPSWVTAELIESTLLVWQPYYTDTLSPTEALEIILNVDRMLDAISFEK